MTLRKINTTTILYTKHVRSISFFSAMLAKKVSSNSSSFNSLVAAQSKILELERIDQKNSTILEHTLLSESSINTLSVVSSSIEAFDIINKNIEDSYDESNTEFDFLGTSNKFFDAISSIKDVSRLTETTNSYIDDLAIALIEINKKLAYTDEKAAEVLQKSTENLEQLKYDLKISKAKQLIVFSGLVLSGCICVYAILVSPTKTVVENPSYGKVVPSNSSLTSNTSAMDIMTSDIISSRTSLDINSPLVSINYKKEKFSKILPVLNLVIKFAKNYFFSS